jgi:hypothetical protein
MVIPCTPKVCQRCDVWYVVSEIWGMSEMFNVLWSTLGFSSKTDVLVESLNKRLWYHVKEPSQPNSLSC